MPQLYVDGEFVGGCDIVMSSQCGSHSGQKALLTNPDGGVTVHQNGELKTLLEKIGDSKAS